RHHLRILRDRQSVERHEADQDDDDRDDRRKDGPVDEEAGEHALSFLGARGRAGTALDLRARGRGRGSLGLHRDALRVDGDSGPGTLDAIHDDPVAWRQTAGDGTEPVCERAELDLAVLDDVLVVHDQHVLPTLIGADRALGDEHRRLRFAGGELHAHEEARREDTLLVLQYGAHPYRPGPRVDLVVDEVDQRRVGKASFVGEADPHGDLQAGDVLRRDRATGSLLLRLAQAQQRWLVDVEVHPDRIEAHDGREDGAPARTHHHEIAGGDPRAARPARDWRGDAGGPEVEPGLRALGLRGDQLTLGAAFAGGGNVHLALAHGA